MSLFQFGFQLSSGTHPVSHDEDSGESYVCSTLPSQSESGLGRSEYELFAAAVSSGTYTTYTPEQRAKIGRYALENGNGRARRHFLLECPNLKESIVRSFKKAYAQELLAIQTKPKGRPPALLEFDGKLIKFLKAVRAEGGVLNINVVRAASKALIASNPSSFSLKNFSLPRSWVQSLYRWMGCTIRAGNYCTPASSSRTIRRMPKGFLARD